MGDVIVSTIGASDSTAMILTCPACATSYFVDDAKIGSEGRTVRCASCGERWLAKLPQEDGAPAPVVSDEQRAESAATRRAQRQKEAQEAAQASAPSDDGPMMFAAQARSRKKAAPQISPMVITGVLAAVLVASIAATVVMRADVVRMWPQSASAYALVGLAPNPTGLALEGIKADRILKDGHAALSVTGAIRNVSQSALIAPPLRITLTDPAGKTVAVQIAKPDGVTLPVGAVRYFAVAIIDPPALARDMDVDFVLDKPVQKAPAAHSSDKKLGPAASEPPHGAAREVKPLPAGSPYALHDAEGTGGEAHTASPKLAVEQAPTVKPAVGKAQAAKAAAHGHD
jgi:predicted Zn finger-like uncharacterized protein